MKRRGFTLAEVLITLGIIGVVAALTIPEKYWLAESCSGSSMCRYSAHTITTANPGVLGHDNYQYSHPLRCVQ
jgi:prepilin-type N-terminal cleavage/methylation domain-containing protein